MSELDRIAIEYDGSELNDAEIDQIARQYESSYEDEVRYRMARETPLPSKWATLLKRPNNLQDLLPLLFHPIHPGNVVWNIREIKRCAAGFFVTEPYSNIPPTNLDWMIAVAIQQYLLEDISLREDGSFYCGMYAKEYMMSGNWNAPQLTDFAPLQRICEIIADAVIVNNAKKRLL